MKSLKIVLTLVLVLGVTGTTFAAFTISVDPPTFPHPGLASYMVKVGGVKAFNNIQIAGGVHQVHYNYGIIQPSPDLDWPLVEAFNITVDTHLMAVAGTMGGISMLESPSNDFGDDEFSSGLDEYSTGLFAPVVVGMGTYAMSGAAEGFTTASLLPGGTAFMQIVIPDDAFVYLDMSVSDGETTTPVHQQVGVPEPSTILMLLAGSLCLLAVRSRK